MTPPRSSADVAATAAGTAEATGTAEIGRDALSVRRGSAGVASAVAGSLVPLQAAINAQLAHALRSTFGAAAVSMTGSGLVLLPAAIVTLRSCASWHQAMLRPWMLSGGLFGAAYISSLIVLSQSLGFASSRHSLWPLKLGRWPSVWCSTISASRAQLCGGRQRTRSWALLCPCSVVWCSKGPRL